MNKEQWLQFANKAILAAAVGLLGYTVSYAASSEAQGSYWPAVGAIAAYLLSYLNNQSGKPVDKITAQAFRAKS